MTAPTGRVARRLAERLIQSHTAACVNIVRGVHSVFWWQGKRETAREDVLIVKTTRQRMPDLKRLLRQHHPYTVPELIVLPIIEGLPAYLQWVRASCR